MPDHAHQGDPSERADTGLDRRGFLLAGAAAGVGAAGALGVPTGTAGAFAAPSRDPVSMAMHIHSSFSEGTASMDAHLHQARRLGVDVVWWTEHDFRLTAHGYRTHVGFDGPREPADRWDFDWKSISSGPLARADHSFVSSPANPDESGDKMQVVATAKQDSRWATHVLQAHSQNAMYTTSYADTTIELDIYAEQLGDDARVVVEIVSSYRPARAGRKAGQYRIQYRLGDPVGKQVQDGGLTGVVGLDAPPIGRWHRLRLTPREDHADLWPDTVSWDASLHRLNLGVMVRSSADARVVFDRLRFHRTRNGSTDSRALQDKAIREYRRRYPNITQFAAAEVSLVRHLNAFGGTGALPSYPTPDAVMNSSVTAQRAMIEELRGQGATVTLNHPLVGGSARDLAAKLIRTDGMGAQLIEIGTTMRARTLPGVFDIAARNAVMLTAIGTTDDHSGQDWLSGRRWLTRVWSPTRQEADLCRNLEAGRAWFYDPRHWDGALNLVVAGQHMGGVRFTKNREVNVAVRATDLPKGAFVQLVVGACDFAGVRSLEARNRIRRLPRAHFKTGVWRGRLNRGSGCYVRVVVRRAGGAMIGFSNPVWVLPAHRRADLAVPTLRR